MQQDKKSVTMKDVAKIAGVSIATISRSLGNPEKLSPTTRQKVKQAIKTSGYTIDSNRSHNHYRSLTLLIVITGTDCSIFTESIQEVQTTIAEEGYCSILLDCSQPKERIRSSLNTAFIKHIDAVVMLGNGPLFDFLHLPPFNQLPKVNIHEFNAIHHQSSFHIDHLSAAFDGVNYLYQLGHQRIAYIGGPENRHDSLAHKQGYIQALQRWGVAIEQSYIVPSQLSYQAGANALTQLMSLPQPPSAIFCHSDIQAIGVLYQAKKMELKVPQALSIMGYGDIKLAQYVDPPLTTIAIPYQQMGKLAMIELLKQLQSPLIKKNSCLLASELVVRATTVKFQC